jgi:hypothetical protein
MRALADNGRFVLAESEGRLLFLERRGLIPAWAIFVVGLLTVIFAINGGLLLWFGALAGDARLGVGLGMLVAGLLAGWGCAALVRRRRARNQRGLDPSEAIVVLDRPAGVLRDRAGRVLAPLDQVRFVRRMQLTSSSRALHAVWPGGDWAVYRGDPFAGGIEDATGALAQRGVPVA